MLSPKQFMKARRPENFSDSTLVGKSSLNRSILEYKLDTITSNSLESEFQTFCLKPARPVEGIAKPIRKPTLYPNLPH